MSNINRNAVKQREFALRYAKNTKKLSNSTPESRLYTQSKQCTRTQAINAADVLFRVMYPNQAKRLKNPPIQEIYKNDISEYLKNIIVSYACSSYSKSAPEFRVLRDGYSQLCKTGQLTHTVRHIIDVPKYDRTKRSFYIKTARIAPSTIEDVKRLWMILDPKYTTSDTPRHHENCFLEDQGHDWNKHTLNGELCIKYFGTLNGQKGRLVLEC